MVTNAKQKTDRGIWGWLVAIGLFLFAKAKWVLALFKIGKFATLASMFISLWGYALFYGWKFAFALIYLIFIHEMGHLVAAKMKKIPTSPAVFIPFLGAAIGIDPKKINNAKTEFFIAYGGPLAGLLSVMPAIALYFITTDPYWGLVIQLGALINLFNLFPVSPLDGGRIVSVLSTNIWLIGLLILVPFLFLSPDPILILIFIFGLFTWWNRLKENTKVEVMKHEETVLTNINKELENATDAPVYSSMELQPFTSQLTANHFIRLANKLTEQKNRADHFLSSNKGFHFPVIQEKKRLEIRKKQAEKTILATVLNRIDIILGQPSELYFDQAAAHLQTQNEKKMEEIKKEINRLKTYYQTSLQTKIRSLILYIALAVLLALLLMYGNNILEGNQFTRF